MKYRCFILSIIAFLFMSCEEWLSYKIENNSESVLNFYLALEEGRLAYPDTVLSFGISLTTRIPLHTTYRFAIATQSIEEWLAHLPKDTLSIYFFSKDTIAYYSWEEIQAGYKVLARYDLSIENIKKLGYTIPYPPTPKMWYMKMYPAYEYYENDN